MQPSAIIGKARLIPQLVREMATYPVSFVSFSLQTWLSLLSSQVSYCIAFIIVSTEHEIHYGIAIAHRLGVATAPHTLEIYLDYVVR